MKTIVAQALQKPVIKKHKKRKRIRNFKIIFG